MTTETTTILEVRSSPHLHGPLSVDKIMRNVVYALLPLAAFAIWNFGLSAALLLTITTATCILTEHAGCRLSGNRSTVNDWSATITGLLLGLALPPGYPLWMAVVGGLIAIAPGKLLFGGLGSNVFNPALVGRAFLQAAFPVAISTYTPAGLANRFTEFIPTTLTAPLMKPAAMLDAFTSATPLVMLKFDHLYSDPWPMFWGQRSGSSGEMPGFLILLCGAYLVARKMMDWRITAAMLAGAIATATLFHLANPQAYPDAIFTLFTGGLLFGATFMATDPVASPVTPRGMWIYGILMGFLTVLIRNVGGLPEGVMYAILLGNALSPLIDKLTPPRPYGARKPAGAK
ncbi:MAG: RnfABCDGE type electron transport complex subunit D [Acidobacteria bacterium]|nr:RnfABCDGE type electron transport complex subunit D [Acidobacteriota bacterium]